MAARAYGGKEERGVSRQCIDRVERREERAKKGGKGINDKRVVRYLQ